MGRLSARRLRLVLLYLVITLPLVAYGAMQSLSSNANSPIDWVTSAFEPRADYDRFCAAFGPGDAVVASWDGCTVDEPRLDELLRALRESKLFHDADGRWYFNRVASGREIVVQLATRAAPLAWAEAAGRLQGTLVGPDGRTTCVVITFTPAGLKQRQRLVWLIQAAIEDFCGAPPDTQHLAGPVIDGLSVDVASKAALNRLALPSALVVLVAACWCLRSVRVGMFVFGLSVLAQGATLALVYYGGETMSALLIVLPPLVQVLAVAGGIHLANYYFDALPEYGPQGAPTEALRRGWLPCVLSAGTTAVGMASLMVSKLTPIRAFGAFSAAGVLVTAGLLLAVLPALFVFWPVKQRGNGQLGTDGTPAATGGWSAMTGLMVRYNAAIVVGGLVLMIAAGGGIRYLTSSVRIETLFGHQSRIVDDYAWLEQHVGPLVPIEVVVTFDADCPLSPEARMTLLWRLGVAARDVPEVGGTLSATTLMPSFPRRDQVPPEVYAGIVHQTLAAARPAFEKAGRLVVVDGQEQWRLSAYVSALSNIDYGAFLDQLRARLDPILVDDGHQALAGVRATYTGIMPLVHELQRQLMDDLFRSFVAAFALIALVMTVAQAGVLVGLVTMIPNVFPTLVMFGLLGWIGMPLDIGTVMTASIALGIAVDDTLHYVTFFRRAIADGRPRHDAVRWAYQHCGKAMVQTSIVCSLGLAVFMWTDFVPTQRFAWMMVSLIVMALAGDLVLLPALLVGPAGRLFEIPLAASPVPDERSEGLRQGLTVCRPHSRRSKHPHPDPLPEGEGVGAHPCPLPGGEGGGVSEPARLRSSGQGRRRA